MWKWKDLTPFGQGIVAGIVLVFWFLLHWAKKEVS